jgi:hypothetical protein
MDLGFRFYIYRNTSRDTYWLDYDRQLLAHRNQTEIALQHPGLFRSHSQRDGVQIAGVEHCKAPQPTLAWTADSILMLLLCNRDHEIKLSL